MTNIKTDRKTDKQTSFNAYLLCSKNGEDDII